MVLQRCATEQHAALASQPVQGLGRACLVIFQTVRLSEAVLYNHVHKSLELLATSRWAYLVTDEEVAGPWRRKALCMQSKGLIRNDEHFEKVLRGQELADAVDDVVA